MLIKINEDCCLFTLRRNYVGAQKTPQVKTQRSRGTEKTVSARGRKGRKSARRRRRRRRSGRRRRRRNGNERERRSVRGRETENGTEIETGRGTGGCAEATPTVVTPVERQTGNGADPAIAGGPGAETRRGRGNASAAGTADFLEPH